MRKLEDFSPVRHYGKLLAPTVVCQSCWLKTGVIRPYAGMPTVAAEVCSMCGGVPSAFNERGRGFVVATPASVPEAFKLQLWKRLRLHRHDREFVYLEVVTDFFNELRGRGIITVRDVDKAIAVLGTKEAEKEWRETK